MDDLTVLREVRAAEPGPSAAETTAARNALLTAIETAGRSSSGRRAARMRRAMAPRRIWVPVAAAAAAVVAVASVLTLAPGRSHLAAPRPGAQHHAASRLGAQPHAGPVAPVYHDATLTAAVVLNKAAAAAALQAEASGTYFFTESEEVSALFGPPTDPETYRQGPYLRRMWFGNGVDGSLVMQVGGGQFNLGPSSNSGLNWAQLRALPTAQAPLLATVAQLAVGLNPKYPDSTAFSEFEIIGQLLFESPIPPAVQAALYQVAAGLPGIEVTDTTDLVGRPAVEVYLEPGPDDPPAAGHALYFSPVTFQLLGEATIDAANVSCPVLSSSAILATGYVSSDTQLPAGTPTKPEPAYYSNSGPGCPALVPIPATIVTPRQLGSWLRAHRHQTGTIKKPPLNTPGNGA
jgi:hypothetical protein